jgi:hypothetical protein
VDGIDLNLPLTRQIVDECSHFKDFNKYLDEALKKADLKK